MIVYHGVLFATSLNELLNILFHGWSNWAFRITLMQNVYEVNTDSVLIQSSAQQMEKNIWWFGFCRFPLSVLFIYIYICVGDHLTAGVFCLCHWLQEQDYPDAKDQVSSED